MDPEQKKPLWQKLGWFVFLWAGGVATVALVGYALRFTVPH